MVYTDPQNTGLSESPEQAARKRQLDDEFEERGKNANFEAGAKGLKDKLGIGEIDPEIGLQLVGEVREAEAKEGGDDEPDLDAAIDEANMGLNPENTEETPKDGESVKEGEEVLPESALDEHEYAPLIDRLTGDHVITTKQAQQIKQELGEGGEFTEVISNLEGISDSIKELINDRYQELNSKDFSEKFAQKFEEHYGAEFKEFKNEKGEFISDRAQEAYEMIAHAYMLGENDASPYAQKKALDMAINMAANSAIHGKQFERNETFVENFRDVKNANISLTERFQALQTVLSIVDTSQGKAGKKQSDRFEKNQQNTIRNAKLDQEFQTAQTKLGELPKDTSLIKEVPDTQDTKPKQGDAKLFGGGKLDMVQSGTENQNRAT